MSCRQCCVWVHERSPMCEPTVAVSPAAALKSLCSICHRKQQVLFIAGGAPNRIIQYPLKWVFLANRTEEYPQWSNVCWISVLDYDVWWSNWREERLPLPTSRRTWSMRRLCSNPFTSRKRGKITEAPRVETTIDRLHSLATMVRGSQREWMRIISEAINQSCSLEFHSRQFVSAWR